VPRLILRVVGAAGARGNSPAFALGYGGLRQSARFNPFAPPMLGAGQWEHQNQKLKSHLLAPFEDAALDLSL